MGYSWKTIDENFDRSLPISKIKWKNGGRFEGWFVELPNINVDNGTSWNYWGSNNAAKGYPTENRFDCNAKQYSNRYYNFYDEKWEQQIHTTLVDGAYIFDCPVTLYWGGKMSQYNYSAAANCFEVYVYEHTFSISKSNARFATSGGTETVEIEAETTWTASTPSFVSVSPSTGDTGTTQVTISCPSYTGETRREDVITFTDNDDYTLTFKARQNGNSAGFSNIYLGDNNLLSNTIYLGDNAVNTIYLGEEIVYSSGPFVGLKASPQTLQLDNNHNTANITIRSSENWAITDDSGGWLSYSITTGTTGKTVVTVTAATTQADRTATITITTANYSATTTVQNAEHFYLQPQSNEIYYTTRSGNPIGSNYNEGINIESITYDGDYGIITFDGVPYLNSAWAGGHFGGTRDVTCWWLPENITARDAHYCFEWQDYCTEMFCYMQSGVPSNLFQNVQENTQAVMHIPKGCSSSYTNSGIFGANKSNWTVVDDL